MQAGKKEGYYRTPDYHIGNRPHTAKFKVTRNVRLFTLYSVNSNLQDEIAGQDGSKKWTFCKFDGRRSSRKYILNLFISKIFMRYSKTNTTWFISRSSWNSWSLVLWYVRLLPSASRREVVSRIQHLGTSNFNYFPQYHVVFVYYRVCRNCMRKLIPSWLFYLKYTLSCGGVF